MNKISHGKGNQKVTDWHPELPFLQKPRLKKGFKVLDGIKFYMGFRSDKIYRADLFDKVFG